MSLPSTYVTSWKLCKSKPLNVFLREFAKLDVSERVGHEVVVALDHLVWNTHDYRFIPWELYLLSALFRWLEKANHTPGYSGIIVEKCVSAEENLCAWLEETAEEEFVAYNGNPTGRLYDVMEWYLTAVYLDGDCELQQAVLEKLKLKCEEVRCRLRPAPLDWTLALKDEGVVSEQPKSRSMLEVVVERLEQK